MSTASIERVFRSIEKPRETVILTEKEDPALKQHIGRDFRASHSKGSEKSAEGRDTLEILGTLDGQNVIGRSNLGPSGRLTTHVVAPDGKNLDTATPEQRKAFEEMQKCTPKTSTLTMRPIA